MSYTYNRFTLRLSNTYISQPDFVAAVVIDTRLLDLQHKVHPLKPIATVDAADGLLAMYSPRVVHGSMEHMRLLDQRYRFVKDTVDQLVNALLAQLANEDTLNGYKKND